MSTWHLPGGHRITGVLDVPEEFTPTAEEYFWSAVMPVTPHTLYRMMEDKSGETMFYFAANMSLATASTWASSGESIATLRMMYYGRALPGALRVAPMVALPVVATAAGLEVGLALFHEAAYAAGADVAPSATKPWFIPLPIWILMH